MEIARIDLDECGAELYEVLDSHSGEWVNYYKVVQKEWDDDVGGISLRSLLILDCMTLVPEARGHGLGLGTCSRV